VSEESDDQENQIIAPTKCDTNLYKERGEEYPIIANKILHLGNEKQERPYRNKTNYSMLKESFDPIRIRLRLMPISRARAKGMNADYYFLEAGKKSMRGNLTAAIE
jgi:hypothetical protein